MLRYYPDKEIALGSIGALHAIALFPALLFTRQRAIPIILTMIACAAYPIWGYTSGFVFCGLGAPFMHSAIWGVVLCIALRRDVAIAYLAVVGVLTTACMFLAMEYDLSVTGQSDEWGFSAAILSWHIFMMFVLPLILRHNPEPSHHARRDPRICQYCEYSLVGLDPDAVCPECGTVRAS